MVNNELLKNKLISKEFLYTKAYVGRLTFYENNYLVRLSFRNKWYLLRVVERHMKTYEKSMRNL